MRSRVLVSGAFDDVRSSHIRFLEEAAKLGEVTVLLWTDSVHERLLGQQPKFPEQERQYFLQAIRFVSQVVPVHDMLDPDRLPETLATQVPSRWVVPEAEDSAGKQSFCRSRSLAYSVLRNADLQGFPRSADASLPIIPGRKKVIVSGCYDWLHSGHVRFFEEVSGYGDLYVVLGQDANIRRLKGEGHPLYPEAERRYVVGSIRFVHEALIASGEGWLDAAPEIERLHPDIYAVNEDGDKGGKREYCAQRGLEYLVLKRTPAAGLPRRSSSDLRGF